MCTVSWLHTDDGYHLLCNRDERLTRKPALAPRIKKQRGVHVVAPSDGDHGGSWIGVNQFGLALCLLNRYDESTDDLTGPYTSRGLLLMELLDSPSLHIAQSRIQKMELNPYRPFTLLVLEPDSPSLVIEWSGRERLIEDDGQSRMPLISSSFDTGGVAEFRKRLFERMVARSGRVDADLLCAFQTSHDPAPGPYSPCMHREDARTVSFSWIKVTRRAIEFLYNPQSACSDAVVERIELQRAITSI